MIKQMYVKIDDVAYFVEEVGAENVISILPLQFETSTDGINHAGRFLTKAESIITSYILVYHS